MIIANPIYDVIFKMLMENERIAKFFIGTILDVKIEHIDMRSQEFTYRGKFDDRKVFRLDFIATIQTAEESKKVLIEVQKSKKITDLGRFRNYLGHQYAHRDEADTNLLPLATIYVLGFNLPGIESPCVKIERRYVDCVRSKILAARHPFIEGLTHDSYFIQTRRIGGRPQTVLDKLLSVFEQNYFIETNNQTRKSYNYMVDDEDLDLVIETLRQAGESAAVQQELRDEMEMWRTIEEHIQSYVQPVQEELEKKQTELSQKNEQLSQKDQQLSQQEQQLLQIKRENEILKAQLNQNKS